MAKWIDFKELRQKLPFADVLKHYSVELKVKGDRASPPMASSDSRKQVPPEMSSSSCSTSKWTARQKFSPCFAARPWRS
jgi:hypothetical protein